jgi:hypothetical protein
MGSSRGRESWESAEKAELIAVEWEYGKDLAIYSYSCMAKS